MDRIVVGVDGTPESVAAARSAGGLAGKMGFNVTLAFVVSSATALGPEEMLGQRLEWEREEEERGAAEDWMAWFSDPKNRADF